MVWDAKKDFAGAEAAKIWPILVPYTRGRTLDVGSGKHRLFNSWTTLDSGQDYKARVADLHLDAHGKLPFEDSSWDNVFSSHFLEHVPDYKLALSEWFRMVRPGGHLVLYLPHKAFYPNIGQPGANPDHKHDFLPGDIYAAMVEIADRTGSGWDLVRDEERNARDEYSFLQVYRKRTDAVTTVRPWRRPALSALVIRYGAAGDQIVASSILPLLKAKGYHITYNTAPDPYEVVKHDPHIDDFMIQDVDQVRNEDLGIYWEFMRQEFDLVINLSESVEGALLTLPGRINDTMPQGAKNRLLDVNYLERTHDLAGVPWDFRPAFYPTPEEVAQVGRQLSVMPKGPYILWILRGSSPHKLWPYLPQAIVRLLNKTDATIILAGAKDCQGLEEVISEAAVSFYGSAARIQRTCGLWPVRATMALAQQVDLVVGPETGVLNAVCRHDVPKVVLLSHSSEEMLTKHWTNTTVLQAAPERSPCFPCRMLHHDWSRCHKHEETGTALCQAAIGPEEMVDAIVNALRKPVPTFLASPAPVTKPSRSRKRILPAIAAE